MTKPLPWVGRFALLLLLPVGLLPLLATVHRSVPQVPEHRFHDWSTRHAIYSQTGTSAALEAARSDPRALFRWREVEQGLIQQRQLQRPQSLALWNFRGRRLPRRFPNRKLAGMQRDWIISLGTAGTANSMYPAKFTFDVTVAPSCANDFVVFPVNAVGSAAQPNIVAFNNLYSGTAGGNGVCNRAATGNDTGVAATVMWSYNVHAIAAGGAVPTSPVLSLDGAKVAFVESAAGNPAHFHVLAWKTGDGRVANLQNALLPKAIVAPFSATAPAAASGAATDLSFGTTTDTLSSPYIDYANDLAYVGNDIGVVYRIKNVFCTTASCGTAAPSLDTTWGGGTGAVTIGGTCTGAAGKLTAPVLNYYNLNVYVGCADGKLYSISQTGTINPLVVGDGVTAKTFGGIVDPPIVDGVNGFIYAVSGSANNGANGVLVQAKANFSSSVAVPIGAGNQCNIHAPAFSNTYFTNPAAANSLIFVGGVTGTVGPCTAGGATGGAAVLYGATFGAGGILNAGPPANARASVNPVGSEYAPIGEFFNANIGTGRDSLFVSLLRNTNNGLLNVFSFDITNGWTTPFNPQNQTTEGLGASGMVVDNSSASGQASSIYFNALNENAACSNPQTGANTGGCAVKLTQVALQ
jgi:hypothetical protein